MDTITSLVGVLETELEGGEPTTSLSSLNALYALYALQNRAEAAEAEVGRLQAALDQWKQCGDAIMLCATGRAAPLSDSDVCGEIARRRTQVATMEAELAMTSNALRVTQDSVLRNIDRADVAEAEVKRLRAQVVTLEALWQRAIDADLLDDPHELGNAIADASALLNYPPPGDDD